MNKKAIQAKAKDIRERVGGTIFGFPIKEDDPFSEYAVVLFAGGKYHLYPKAGDISHAAIGVLTLFESLKEAGLTTSFEKDVRLVSYDAQLNAPDVRMRRLKNTSGAYRTI
ncbi:hypothetical protein ACL02P_15515 [Paenibacillus sp. MB22_1]|uniref:hypothetical protein n=1 Tax=Paenibacillus sp. MB22_1 TaxID=3383121 RepID=UPI0039A04046